MCGRRQARVKPAEAGAGIVITIVAIVIMSSSDDCGLKVLENEATEGGGSGGGNMRAQFLRKVSTIAWTMPARPHQSECLLQHQANALLAYHMPHTHLELKCGT